MKAEYRLLLENGATTPWKKIDFAEINFNNVAPDWDFIENFYGGYYHSPDVFYSNCLNSYLDGNLTLDELNERCNEKITSEVHAEKEQERIDNVLMKQALSDFMQLVIKGKIQFKTQENDAA